MGYFSPEVSENAFEDALTLGAVVNSDENAIVESRLGATYPSLAKALYTVIQTGGFEPFTTEAALLASVPTVPKKAAKALDTKKIWYWNGSAWVDTGLSELDLAKSYADANPLFKPESPTSGFDFQTKIIDGRIRVTTNVIAAACTNIPEASAGVLDVVNISPTYLIQTYRVYNSSNVYDCQKTSAGWGAWVKRLGTTLDKTNLSTATQRLFSTRAEWFAVGGGDVTYDSDSRVLSWTVPMLIQSSLNASNRLNIPAGSITVPTDNFSIVYLDLTTIPTDGNIIVANSIKTGKYVGGAYRESLDVIPMVKIDPTLHGAARPAAGFLPVKVTGTASLTKDETKLYLSKTATKLMVRNKASGANWVQWTLERDTVPFDGTTANSQLDLWRLKGCAEVNSAWTGLRNIVGTGEHECAIAIVGETDHVGGYHGDELLTSAFFLIDGVRYEQDAVFDTTANEVRFIQKSIIYRQNSSTQFAEHTQDYLFTTDGIKLIQSIKALINISVGTMYFGMLPIRRNLGDVPESPGAQVTDTAIRMPDYISENVASSGFTVTYKDAIDGQELLIYSNVAKVSALTKWSNFVGLPKPNTFIQNSAIYNKVYFAAKQVDLTNPSSNPLAITAGQVFGVTTNYQVTIAA